MSTDKTDIFILYGSQTGNAEFIAKELHGKCLENNLPAQCLRLNDVTSIILKDVAKIVLIVCATTGNGDAPENADGWWRKTKLRSVAKDFYAGVPYAVLGLGDTNYDKFCHMGISIDKRLDELGGTRLMPIECADEATGLEEPVERWKAAIFQKLLELK